MLYSPTSFSRIFSYAFGYNQVPKSSYESDIPEEYYNTIITQNNRLYIQNQNTTLYIYRCPIDFIIDAVRNIQNRLLRASPAF